MTHHRYTNNTRPMDYHKLHRSNPVWRKLAVGALVGAAAAVIGAILLPLI